MKKEELKWEFYGKDKIIIGTTIFTLEELQKCVENKFKRDEKIMELMAQTLLNYGFILIKSKKGIIEHFRKLVVKDERN